MIFPTSFPLHLRTKIDRDNLEFDEEHEERMTTSAGDKQSKVDNCGDLRKFIEKLKCKDTDKETSDCNLNTTKSDGDSDASQDEMIIQKRRLNRLKFLSKFKDEKKEEVEVNSNMISMDNNVEEEDSIPIAFFEQPNESVDDEEDNCLPVVFFNLELQDPSLVNPSPSSSTCNQVYFRDSN